MVYPAVMHEVKDCEHFLSLDAVPVSLFDARMEMLAHEVHL